MMLRSFCLLIIAYSWLLSAEQPVTVIVPSYNNAACCIKNLQSIINQDYRPLHVIYVDDCSTDGTGERVQAYIEQKKLSQMVTLIRNPYNRKAMANIYTAVHMCSDDQLITVVDGDDALAHTQVIRTIVAQHQKHDAWISYAQYKNVPESKAKSLNLPVMGCAQQMPEEVIARSSQRKHPWCWSGLRTFYAWIFKQIRLNDLLDTRAPHVNKFYAVCCDNAYFFPLLEMSGDHALFIPEILLLRNVDTPLNDFKVHKHEQRLTAHHIRSMQPYQRLHQPIVARHETPRISALIVPNTGDDLTHILSTLASTPVSSIVIVSDDPECTVDDAHVDNNQSLQVVSPRDLATISWDSTHLLYCEGSCSPTIELLKAAQLLDTTYAYGYCVGLTSDVFGTQSLQHLPLEECAPGTCAFRCNDAKIKDHLLAKPLQILARCIDLMPLVQSAQSCTDIRSHVLKQIELPSTLCLCTI